MSDSVRLHRWQPTRLPRPWDSPGKNTGVGFHFLLQCMKVKSESEIVQLFPTLRDPMDYQAPPSMGFSRQEYWNGVPLPSPIAAIDDTKKACFTTSKCKDICMSALIKIKTCYIMECIFLKLSA